MRIVIIRDPKDPFRAEFNYGGSVPQAPFPPALRYTGLKSKSVNVKTTGLWPEDELNINPTIPADIAEDKVVPLVINDSDLAENPPNSLFKIDSGRTTDINPALELTRGVDGVMQGAGGDDTFHYLRIDAVSPIIRYNRHEQNYQALDVSCAGRPTDLCGTEAEPVNISYSSVPFSYTDIGSGLKELKIYKEILGGTTFYERTGMSQSQIGTRLKV